MDIEKQPAQNYPIPKSTLALAIALPVLNIIIVSLRFATRRANKIPIKIDDWLCLPALALSIGLGAMIIVGVTDKVLAYPSPPVTNIPLFVESLTVATKIQWAFYLMSIPCLGFIKCSILLFLRRIFYVKTNWKFGTFVGVMIAIIAAWSISFFFGFLFACGTKFSSWFGTLEELRANCIQTYEMTYALAMSDILTDAIIFFTPIPLVVFRLRLSVFNKLVVTGILLLGGIALGASIARLFFITKAVDTNDPERDIILLITQVVWWGYLEVGVGLMAACLPSLRPLFKGYSPESVINSIRSALSLSSLSGSKPDISAKSSASKQLESSRVGRSDPNLPQGAGLNAGTIKGSRASSSTRQSTTHEEHSTVPMPGQINIERSVEVMREQV